MKTFWKTTRPILVVAGVAILFLLSYFIISFFSKDHEPQAAYDVTGVMADGSSLYSLSDNYGKTGTVLVFFDIDTGKATELLTQLHAAAPDYPVDILAVATSKKTMEEQKRQLEELGVDFPHILFDLDGKMAETYNVHGTPVTYFIDKNGLIQDAFIASISEKSLRKALASLA